MRLGYLLHEIDLSGLIKEQVDWLKMSPIRNPAGCCLIPEDFDEVMHLPDGLVVEPVASDGIFDVMVPIIRLLRLIVTQHAIKFEE